MLFLHLQSSHGETGFSLACVCALSSALVSIEMRFTDAILSSIALAGLLPGKAGWFPHEWQRSLRDVSKPVANYREHSYDRNTTEFTG